MIDNQYIITICNELVKRNFARSLANIAVKCGKSKQYFSDLKKNNAQFSSSFLDKLEENYPIINRNYAYTGEGSPIKDAPGDIHGNEKGVFIPYENLASFIMSQQRIMESQQRTIENLSKKTTARTVEDATCADAVG